MKKVCSFLTALIIGFTISLVATGNTPANAAGCGVTQVKQGSNLVKDQGDLLGGVHVWNIRVSYQDCDGYDRVAGYVVHLEKDSSKCGPFPSAHVNNYDFNPDTLEGYNPGTVTRDCGNRVYNIGFVPPNWLIIRNHDDLNQKCVGASVQVDKALQSDYNGTVPKVCLNGK